MPSLQRSWTYDDLQRLPDDGNRYEVIDGELFVSPSPSLAHQAALRDLFRLVDPYVRQHQLGHTFFAPVDITFSPRRVVQPDLLVLPSVNGRRPASYGEVNRLMLAIEVLSQSTARADRVAKRRLYREEGVPEYWIVDLEARVVERTTPADTRAEILSETLEWWPTGAGALLTIDLVEFFAAVLDG